MFFLVAILLSAAVFGLFIALTVVEKKRSVRFFANTRVTLDRQVSRITFLINHIDFGGFLLHVVRTISGHIAHDIASMTLRAVRAFDRVLSSLVRRLRKPRDERVSLESGSKYVKTMSYFKKNLQNPHAPKAEEITPSSEAQEGITQ